MKIIIIFIFILSGLMLMAQPDTAKYWKIENKASLNFSQSYFSNWSAGGENTLAGTGKYTSSILFSKEKHQWSNWLNLALGYSYFGNHKAIKTDDKLELISSYGYKIHKKLYATILVTFKSQIAKGYNYKKDSTIFISNFMASGLVDIGPGIEWEPNDYFSINFSATTVQWLIVNNQRLADEGSFGLDPAIIDSTGVIIEHAKKVKIQFGAKALIVFKYEIFKNVDFGTKLELFSDYLHNPQNIDVNWQVNITMKVNSWLNVNINTELIYNDDVVFHDASGKPIGPRTQFNENMQIGLSITF